jgi:hypothetical protein
MFRYSILADTPAEMPATDASELLTKIRLGPAWDVLTIFPEHGDFPRAHVSWHEGHGFVVQCFEDETSWGFFLAREEPLSTPEVDIVFDDQAQERWPSQLFVDTEVAIEAVDFFLLSGRQKPSLHWVRGEGFSRETVWVGRQGREAWEKSKLVD